MGIVEELYLFDRQNAWLDVFQRVKLDSLEKHNFSLKEARRLENRNRNRYGDVSPYDHSRISLQKGESDYINASLVQSQEANRAYILTQGPLPDTQGHFWLMVWEQQSPAILMLNNLIEKGYIKCHQYFPIADTTPGGSMTFEDVHLKVTLIDDLESNDTYVIRVLLLECTETSERRQVLQFHYTSWPDFGVPESPSTFLDFLFVVRKFGFLDDPSKPPIIHCSAGIGRSGTFCLVDTCLLLAENEGNVEKLCVLDELMRMRRYRMGLIQTPEQLRFTYLAIIEGCSRLSCLKDPSPCLESDLSEGAADRSASNENDEEEDSVSSNSDFEGDKEDDDGKLCSKAVKQLRKTLNDDDSGHHNGGDDDSEDEGEGAPSLPAKKNDRNNNIQTHNANNNTATHNANNNIATHNANNIATHNNNNNTSQWQDASSSDEDDSAENVVVVGGGGRCGVNVKQQLHDERLRKMKETLERMKRRQGEAEERARRGFGWSPYLFGGLSLAVLAGALMAYKMVYN